MIGVLLFGGHQIPQQFCGGRREFRFFGFTRGRLIATYAVASQLDFDFAFASPLSDGSMNFLNVEDPANGPSEEGALANESHTAQQELVIYAIARRAQRIVAAGRAVLPEAPAAKLDPLSDLLRG